jgi:hypothetical protein
MEELTKIIQSDQETLLSSLPDFQAEIIRSFLVSTTNDYLQSADNWLNANTPNTAKFGGRPKNAKIYREKLILELEKFLCDDDCYVEDIKKISESTDKSQKYIIGVMSAAIGNTLGTVGTFIAPVIVLLFINMGKISINAWCAMRKEVGDFEE